MEKTHDSSLTPVAQTTSDNKKKRKKALSNISRMQSITLNGAVRFTKPVVEKERAIFDFKLGYVLDKSKPLYIELNYDDDDQPPYHMKTDDAPVTNKPDNVGISGIQVYSSRALVSVTCKTVKEYGTPVLDSTGHPFIAEPGDLLVTRVEVTHLTKRQREDAAPTAAKLS